MKTIILLLLTSIAISTMNAQVGFGTNNPDPTAAVEIRDSSRGLLIPRMDLAHKNAIQNPATGLVIYQTDSIKGFWYYDGAEWKNINASANYGGKHTIVLSDTISNSEAQAKIALESGPNTQEIGIQNCMNLTSIDLSMFTNLTNISFADNPLLTSINLGNLKSCEGGLYISNCPALTNLNVSSLERIVGNGGNAINALYVNNVGFTTLNFPKLKWLLSYMTLNENPSLTSVSFPALLQLHSISGTYNPSLTTISCPLLQRMGAFQFITNGSLSTLLFPSLTDLYLKNNNTQIWECPNLGTLTIGNLVSYKNNQFYITGGKLTSANVNAILHSLAGITPAVTNNRIWVVGMTPPAPPTGQGLADKALLMSNGNNVVTD